jgi:response regulator RpfG family c-di-GMP phosphodiesterase
MYKQTLLIVDDQPVTVKYLARLLSQQFDVLISSNYQEAIHQIQNNAIDVILCDYTLSEKNGLDVLLYAKEKLPSSRRFIITGLEEDMFESAVNSGVVEHVFIKPLDLEMISHRLIG